MGDQTSKEFVEGDLFHESSTPDEVDGPPTDIEDSKENELLTNQSLVRENREESLSREDTNQSSGSYSSPVSDLSATETEKEDYESCNSPPDDAHPEQHLEATFIDNNSFTEESECTKNTNASTEDKTEEKEELSVKLEPIKVENLQLVWVEEELKKENKQQFESEEYFSVLESTFLAAEDELPDTERSPDFLSEFRSQKYLDVWHSTRNTSESEESTSVAQEELSTVNPEVEQCEEDVENKAAEVEVTPVMGNKNDMGDETEASDEAQQLAEELVEEQEAASEASPEETLEASDQNLWEATHVLRHMSEGTIFSRERDNFFPEFSRLLDVIQEEFSGDDANPEESITSSYLVEEFDDDESTFSGRSQNANICRSSILVEELESEASDSSSEQIQFGCVIVEEFDDDDDLNRTLRDTWEEVINGMDANAEFQEEFWTRKSCSGSTEGSMGVLEVTESASSECSQPAKNPLATPPPAVADKKPLAFLPPEFRYKIVDKICSVPAIHNALDMTEEMYIEVKDLSPAPLRMCWTASEKAVGAAVDSLAWLSRPFQRPFHQLDDLICKVMNFMAVRHDPFDVDF